MLSEQCFNRVYFTKHLTSKVQYMHSIVIVCIIFEMGGVNYRTGKAGCLSICCSWNNCSCHLCLFVIQWNMCRMLNFKIFSWSDICWYIQHMTLYCVPRKQVAGEQGQSHLYRNWNWLANSFWISSSFCWYLKLITKRGGWSAWCSPPHSVISYPIYARGAGGRTTVPPNGNLSGPSAPNFGAKVLLWKWFWLWRGFQQLHLVHDRVKTAPPKVH